MSPKDPLAPSPTGLPANPPAVTGHDQDALFAAVSNLRPDEVKVLSDVIVAFSSVCSCSA